MNKIGRQAIKCSIGSIFNKISANQSFTIIGYKLGTLGLLIFLNSELEGIPPKTPILAAIISRKIPPNIVRNIPNKPFTITLATGRFLRLAFAIAILLFITDKTVLTFEINVFSDI